MKYENAKNILPNDLLIVLQQYVEGTCLYIPSTQKQCSAANQNISAYKLQQQQRNQQIKHEYECGIPVTQLAKRHYLSKQAIYKIIKF